MSIVKTLFFSSLILLGGCSDIIDDLNPAGNDKSLSVVGAAADITVPDSLGSSIIVPADYVGTPIVLYFTMWCGICDGHIKDILYNTVPVPSFSGVRFFLVDYVSATVAQARSNELSWGYGPSFTTLADINNALENYYDGTMGTTVVIDDGGIIRMNEDYLDGSRLRNILTEITGP